MPKITWGCKILVEKNKTLLEQPKKIVLKNEVTPISAGMKKHRENILLSFLSRYHIAKQSRKSH